ncbi:hypothetical protein GCM10011391_17420 [Pullulanibacillus camelliae]|uniref:Uncharacterized protein n=1 Tax=Pullulanibacillus camelliae TaxID=1707096 RepID=A0A8J2VUR1_9BACL|nr:hypothetical protein [Pullulanibacillus camelliae]GGE39132.1 hypothetical protein GCM10011391_17420 [Pullulanibacillus camelliae]
MIENKLAAKPASSYKKVLAKLEHVKQSTEEWDPEKLVDHLSSLLFKGVLFFAVPYFIYILIKFLTMN